MSAALESPNRIESLGPTMRGLLWMALSGLCFALLNGASRVLTEDLHSWQVQCLRYFFGGLVMLPLILRAGAAAFRTNHLSLQIWRNVVHTVGTGFWFLALPMVPLAEVTAIGFTGPIFMTLGAMLFLGEVVRWRRWLAIGLGFLGVTIVLWPKLSLGVGASVGSLLLLAAAPVSAASFLMAKVLTRRDSPEAIVFWQCLLVSLFTLPAALWFWQPVEWRHIAILVFVGAMGSSGHYALNRALKVAEVSAVQPARFLELVWAALVGFVIWTDLPSAWTVAGAAVIFGATTYIARREAIAERATRR
ncbi:MAG: DMT family transporter [Alphaproteobacteria bacterium]|nr:DMT family transporter [Alphaproteobacteria bacterium]